MAKHNIYFYKRTHLLQPDITFRVTYVTKISIGKSPIFTQHNRGEFFNNKLNRSTCNLSIR